MHTNGRHLVPVHADAPSVCSPHAVILSRTGVPVPAPGIDKDPRTSCPSFLDEAAYGHALRIVVAVIPGVIQEQADTIGLRGPHAKPARDIGIVSGFIEEDTDAVIMAASLGNAPGMGMIVTFDIQEKAQRKVNPRPLGIASRRIGVLAPLVIENPDGHPGRGPLTEIPALVMIVSRSVCEKRESPGSRISHAHGKAL